MHQSDKNKRKPIRLARELYAEPYRIVSLTLATLDRQHMFVDHRLTGEFIESLRIASETHASSVLIYCFMPDHVHLLLQNGEGTDTAGFVNSYKSWTTRVAWNYGFKGKIWQRSFYDHILRADEDVERHLRYIIENPVRAGITEVWNDYPFTGSFEYDLTNWEP